MNLLFAVDKNGISLIRNCLWSIVKNGGATQYDVYIIHSDLLDEDKKKLCLNLPKAIKCYYILIPQDMFSDFPVTKRYPQQIYYRLVAPFLLPESLDRILYLDIDTIVINSLETLYKNDFGDAWFMACTHTRAFLTKLNLLRLGMDLSRDVPYINTGVLMMNLPLLRNHLDMNAIRNFVENKQNVLTLPDQDILTALYGDKVKLLDSMIYNLSDRTLNFYNTDPKNEKVDLEWVRNNSVIIHYFGKNKPWKEGYIGRLGVFYQEILALQNQKGKE